MNVSRVTACSLGHLFMALAGVPLLTPWRCSRTLSLLRSISQLKIASITRTHAATLRGGRTDAVEVLPQS